MSGEFVVEYESDWSDYPGDWYEYARVDSAEEGWALINRALDEDYTRELALWEKGQAELKPKLELYARRKAVLEEAGLWKQPGETWIPLVMPGLRLGTPRERPVRADASKWRVRTAAEVDAE